MNLKKMQIVLGLALILALVLGACTPEKEVLVEKQTLIYNSMNGDPDPRAADEEIVAKFMEANPDIEVIHSIWRSP